MLALFASGMKTRFAIKRIDFDLEKISIAAAEAKSREQNMLNSLQSLHDAISNFKTVQEDNTKAFQGIEDRIRVNIANFKTRSVGGTSQDLFPAPKPAVPKVDDGGRYPASPPVSIDRPKARLAVPRN